MRPVCTQRAGTHSSTILQYHISPNLVLSRTLRHSVCRFAWGGIRACVHYTKHTASGLTGTPVCLWALVGPRRGNRASSGHPLVRKITPALAPESDLTALRCTFYWRSLRHHACSSPLPVVLLYTGLALSGMNARSDIPSQNNTYQLPTLLK